MASNFGTAARNAAASIVQRRRNPDPDGVIASQVADRIVNNSSQAFSEFLQQAQASLPPPAPTPAPAPAPPPPSFMDYLMGFGGGGNNGASSNPIPLSPDSPLFLPRLAHEMGGDSRIPAMQTLLPQLGGPGEGPRYERGRGELGPAMVAPIPPGPQPHAVMQRGLVRQRFPETRVDTKSPAAIYEDGSIGGAWPQSMWEMGQPRPLPLPAALGVSALPAPTTNISETGTPYVPPPPPLLAHDMGNSLLDPEVIELLRLLGLIP